MNKLVLLLLLTATGSPAWAQDEPVQPSATAMQQYIVFHADNTRPDIVVIDTQPSNSAPWVESNNDPDTSHYSLVDGQLTYNAPPAPPPQPNPVGFLVAVNNDNLTTANSYALAFQLSGLLAVMQADLQTMPAVGGPQILQAHWSAAVTNFGSSWLTSPVQQMILGYAQQYNIPLVAQ